MPAALTGAKSYAQSVPLRVAPSQSTYILVNNDTVWDNVAEVFGDDRLSRTRCAAKSSTSMSVVRKLQSGSPNANQDDLVRLFTLL